MTDRVAQSSDASPDTPDSTAGDMKGDERLGTLIGDRLCTDCGYNLAGQTIVRERHYRLLMVRCPECGAAASLQEYPLLGRWASRWAIVLAGLWALLILIGAIVIAGLLMGTAWEFARGAASTYAGHLATVQHQWIIDANREDLIDTYNLQHLRSTAYTQRIDDWWQVVDIDQVLADAGGPWAVIDWTALWDLLGWSVFIFVMGCGFAVLIPHAKRRWMPVVALSIGALAAGLAIVFGMAEGPMYYYWMIDVAMEQIGTRLQLIGGALTMIPLMLGLLCGRSLTRLMVRLLLPPRMHSALAGLWRIDGLKPPRGGMA